MVGFGELRRLSVQWHVDIADVERAYAIERLLNEIFEQSILSPALVLRDSAALRYVYFADYPVIAEPDFFVVPTIDAEAIHAALIKASQTATTHGLKCAVIDFKSSAAKIEYTGPLGRRSAAQPHIMLSCVSRQSQLAPKRQPLIHRFSDAGESIVTAIALEEFVAARMVSMVANPRARDIFDLWFAITHGREKIDQAQVRVVVQNLAQTKNSALPKTEIILTASQSANLERVWDRALREIAGHPSLAQVQNDLRMELKGWLP